MIAPQPLPLPQGSSEQAALSAAIKAHGKPTANLWPSWEGQKFYAARGCFHVSEGMCHGLVRQVLTTVAGASNEVVEQLRSLTDFLVHDVAHPSQRGRSRRAYRLRSISASSSSHLWPPSSTAWRTPR